MKRKITSLVLALIIIFSTANPALASGLRPESENNQARADELSLVDDTDNYIIRTSRADENLDKQPLAEAPMIIENPQTEKPKEGYVRITFDPTSKAKDSQVKIFDVFDKATWAEVETQIKPEDPEPVSDDENFFVWRDNGGQGTRLTEKQGQVETSRFVATYVKDVVPQIGSKRPDVPMGYNKVTFSKGQHGKIPATETTIYWVKPRKKVTLTPPKVIAKKGWKHTGWKFPLTYMYSDFVENIAKYSHIEAIVQNITTTIGKVPKPEDAIANKKELLDEIIFEWIKEPDVSKPTNGQPIKATINIKYPRIVNTIQTSTVEITVVDFTEAEKYTPEDQNLTIKEGENPKAEDAIKNKDDLPENTKYQWKENPDTSKAGNVDALVLITYPDGSSEEVLVKIKIQKEAGLITPIPEVELEEEIINWGEDYDLTDNIKDLPEGAKVEDLTEDGAIDNRKSGTYIGKIKITFKDGSTRIVGVTVKASDAEKYTPETQDLTIKEGENPKAEDAIKNKDDLPENTKYQWKENPDTAKAGNVDALVLITYPDRSSEEALVKIKVEKEAGIIWPIPEVDVEEEIVNWGKDYDLTDNIKNLPEGSKVEDLTEDGVIDNKKSGSYTGKIKITFKNGSTRIVEVKVTVKASDAENNPLVYPDITEIDNKDKLRDEEKAEIIKKIKDKNPLTKEVKVDDQGNGSLIYADGSINEIPAEKIVREKEKKPEVPADNNDKEKINPRPDQRPAYSYIPLDFIFGPSQVARPSQRLQKPTKEVSHQAYISGYPQGDFRPEGMMTRAEALAIIAKLEGLKSSSDKGNFSDTKNGAWYNEFINSAYEEGILEEKIGENFRPNDPITRGELARLISVIDKKSDAIAPFADTKGHKYESYINKAYANGRILGYPDGTFRPDAAITRAEVTAMVNRLYNIKLDDKGLEKLERSKDVKKFTDLNSKHWAYKDIMAAANSY
ncbi:Rib/alpha-like domain-containing protein [Neofamilia massiliensis]|uniref:Rib/alpha-like domain-containing protein n=1 Tax=Neofamilia massiliensis TaxID=1673724 RepID=UPI0006BB8894|nr:Rib/alpha-like domain-containing protein [Neofamilia massiliensis]